MAWRVPLLAGLLLAATSGLAAAQGSPLVFAPEVDGFIHPVSTDHMIETMDRADRAGATLVVFTLSTPGGLLDSTRTIVSRMLRATPPVVVFITPAGARAASAGSILTIAADVAAMSPGTHLGAAHPVGGSGPPMDETTARKSGRRGGLRVAAQRQGPATGAETMIGQLGATLTALEPAIPGRVAIHGEIWRATADDTIAEGTPVRVVQIDGLTVTVEKI
jgi:membrane-bound serine protease (ClpP class)